MQWCNQTAGESSHKQCKTMKNDQLIGLRNNRWGRQFVKYQFVRSYIEERKKQR